ALPLPVSVSAGRLPRLRPPRGLHRPPRRRRRRGMSRIALFLAVAAIGLATLARAADPRNPDWPCVQAKVPEISLAAVWAGPPLDDVGNRWESDPQIKDVVARLAARRTPVEEAQKIAAELLAGSGDARLERAKLVFAGLFDTLSLLRSEEINGIEHYTRRQPNSV